MENVDYHTDFSVEKATRKDSGIYTLKAENRNGKDEAQCELVVLGAFYSSFLLNTYIFTQCDSTRICADTFA